MIGIAEPDDRLSRKAHFHLAAVPDHRLADDELMMMTPV